MVLIRLSPVFAPLHQEILDQLGALPAKMLGSEFFLTHQDISSAQQSGISLFVRWQLTIEHCWPCCPEKMDFFIEKAAQALHAKFASRNPQTLLVGTLSPGSPNPYYKKMAVNLRGRALQLFPPLPSAADVESQDPSQPTLYCMIGKEGLYAGMATPRATNGFYAGGSKFIRQDPEHSVSRAGAKIAEALHYIRLYHPELPERAHWLELGASPGGMTAELLERDFFVTAVDRAPLDSRVARHPRLRFYPENANTFRPLDGEQFDALLCDLNGSALDALDCVISQISHLRKGALIVFTMKAHKAATLDEMLSLHRETLAKAKRAGLQFLAQTHLTYNRHEFTLFWTAR